MACKCPCHREESHCYECCDGDAATVAVAESEPLAITSHEEGSAAVVVKFNNGCVLRAEPGTKVSIARDSCVVVEPKTTSKLYFWRMG